MGQNGEPTPKKRPFPFHILNGGTIRMVKFPLPFPIYEKPHFGNGNGLPLGTALGLEILLKLYMKRAPPGGCLFIALLVGVIVLIEWIPQEDMCPESMDLACETR
jgi:hypothetical protein